VVFSQAGPRFEIPSRRYRVRHHRTAPSELPGLFRSPGVKAAFARLASVNTDRRVCTPQPMFLPGASSHRPQIPGQPVRRIRPALAVHHARDMVGQQIRKVFGANRFADRIPPLALGMAG